MKNTHWLALIVLSGISGLSFLLMRQVSPTLPPILVADARALLGGACIIAYAVAKKSDLDWRENHIPYLVIGCLNFALPFCLYSYAAKYLPVAYLSILNSTAPMFGAILSALVFREIPRLTTVLGLLGGMAGVAMVCMAGFSQQFNIGFGIGMLACIAGALCYAITGAYVKHFASRLSPIAISGGAQFAAGLLMVPFAAAYVPKDPVAGTVVASVLVLAVLNSAIAYLIYFRLLLLIGVTRTLTITLLAPAFSASWGFLFLGERLSLWMIAGSVIVLLSVFLVNREQRMTDREKSA
jgi:drug/metabolite transporter (DMT)-like permease